MPDFPFLAREIQRGAQRNEFSPDRRVGRVLFAARIDIATDRVRGDCGDSHSFEERIKMIHAADILRTILVCEYAGASLVSVFGNQSIHDMVVFEVLYVL